MESCARRASALNVGVSLDLAPEGARKRGMLPADFLRLVRRLSLPLRRVHKLSGHWIMSEEQHLVHARALCEVIAELPAVARAGLQGINVSGGFGHDYDEGTEFNWAGYARLVTALQTQVAAVIGAGCPSSSRSGGRRSRVAASC